MATTAVLTLKVDAKQLQRGLLKAEAQVGRLEKRSLGLSTIMKTVFAGAMARAGFAMIKMASQAEETESKLRAVFKGIEREATIVSDSISQKFGLASSTVQEMLSATGDLLTGFKFTKGEALSLSAQVAELAVDLRSFQNFSGGAKGASDILTKALLGETESAKSLGIVIRQNTKEFKVQVASIRKLTGATELQAKAQVIWKQIQDQTLNAQGDALKTYDSTANRLDRMSEGWKGVQESAGRFLIEGLAVDEVVSGLTDGMKFLTTNAHNVKLAIDSVTNSIANLIAKAAIKGRGVMDRFGLVFKFAKEHISSLFSGNTTGMSKVLKEFKQQIEEEKAMLKGLAQFEEEQDKKAVERHSKKENEKRKITTQNAEEAIKEAIKKTEGSVSKIAGVSGSKSDASTRSSQFSGAFEKGSVDAYKIEKNSLGNKTERDNLRANRRTATALESAGTPTLNTIAG